MKEAHKKAVWSISKGMMAGAYTGLAMVGFWFVMDYSKNPYAFLWYGLLGLGMGLVMGLIKVEDDLHPKKSLTFLYAMVFGIAAMWFQIPGVILFVPVIALIYLDAEDAMGWIFLPIVLIVLMLPSYIIGWPIVQAMNWATPFVPGLPILLAPLMWGLFYSLLVVMFVKFPKQTLTFFCIGFVGFFLYVDGTENDFEATRVIFELLDEVL